MKRYGRVYVKVFRAKNENDRQCIRDYSKWEIENNDNIRIVADGFRSKLRNNGKCITVYYTLRGGDEVRLIELLVGIYDPYARRYFELEVMIRTIFDNKKSRSGCDPSDLKTK